MFVRLYKPTLHETSQKRKRLKENFTISFNSRPPTPISHSSHLFCNMSVLHKWRAGGRGACAFRYSHATSTGVTIVGTIEALDTQEARSRAARLDPPPRPLDPDFVPTSSLDFISARPSRATDPRSHLPPLRRHTTPPDLRSSLTLWISFLLGPSLFSLFLPKKTRREFSVGAREGGRRW